MDQLQLQRRSRRFFIGGVNSPTESRNLGKALLRRSQPLDVHTTRESHGIDRFCDYSCVYCVIPSCTRRTQSNGKHKIHQTCQCDAYVYILPTKTGSRGGNESGRRAALFEPKNPFRIWLPLSVARPASHFPNCTLRVGGIRKIGGFDRRIAKIGQIFGWWHDSPSLPDLVQ